MCNSSSFRSSFFFRNKTTGKCQNNDAWEKVEIRRLFGTGYTLEELRINPCLGGKDSGCCIGLQLFVWGSQRELIQCTPLWFTGQKETRAMGDEAGSPKVSKLHTATRLGNQQQPKEKKQLIWCVSFWPLEVLGNICIVIVKGRSEHI